MLNVQQYRKNVIKHFKNIVGYPSRFNKMVKGPDLLVEDIGFDILITRKNVIEVTLTFDQDKWKILDKKNRENAMVHFLVPKIHLNEIIKKHWKSERLPYSVFPDAESKLTKEQQAKSDAANFAPIVGPIRPVIIEQFYQKVHDIDYVNVADRGLYSINNSDPINLEPPQLVKSLRATYGIGIENRSIKLRIHWDFFKMSHVNIAGIKPKSSNVTILESETVQLERNTK